MHTGLRKTGNEKVVMIVGCMFTGSEAPAIAAGSSRIASLRDLGGKRGAHGLAHGYLWCTLGQAPKTRIAEMELMDIGFLHRRNRAVCLVRREL